MGQVTPIHLTPLIQDEIFLTAAQSLFGVFLLAKLHFSLRGAIVLVGLFFVQFFVLVESVRIIIAWIYILLSIFIILRD